MNLVINFQSYVSAVDDRMLMDQPQITDGNKAFKPYLKR